jgi:two-component system response regulator DesR
LVPQSRQTGENGSVIRILFAEDMCILRSALRELLSFEEDIEVVAEVDRGSAILPAVLEHLPDVAILDIDMPELDGIEAARLLYERLPECRVLILTALATSGQLRRAVEARVAGFVSKEVRLTELAEAIRTVAAGGRVMDPALMLAALEARPSPLSVREAEVLRISATGARPLEIAGRLFLSHGTVRNYLGSAVAKLDAKNRIDAIRIAEEAGWL